MPADIEPYRDAFDALCRRVGARRLDLFGSATRDDFDPGASDLDFIVELDVASPADYADAWCGGDSAPTAYRDTRTPAPSTPI